MRKIVIVSLVTFVLGLILGGAVAVRAQLPRTETVIIAKPGPLQLGGNDIALRVTGRSGKRVFGTLMARVDGKWVEVQIAPQDSLIGH